MKSTTRRRFTGATSAILAGALSGCTGELGTGRASGDAPELREIEEELSPQDCETEEVTFPEKKGRVLEYQGQDYLLTNIGARDGTSADLRVTEYPSELTDETPVSEGESYLLGENLGIHISEVGQGRSSNRSELTLEFFNYEKCLQNS